jgi:serine/threonine-protein kinase
MMVGARNLQVAHPLALLQAALAGRYTLERELGQGGMATVYLAKDERHQRLVAIKVLKPEIAAGLGPERFLREIAIAARLNHPHILPLHDSGEANGVLYYVMPFVEGESLRDRLRREGQLPLADALGITRDVASAIAYAHTHDIVHRDIKPENVLLTSGQAVVSDFGIARAVSAAGSGNLTATGVTVGTPAYMSPEQAVGSQQLDGRSDVYSLGCLLYEMLAGRPPFAAPTAAGLLHQHLGASAPPVTTIRPGVPKAVDAAITRALAKAPADRFASASEFAAALAPESARTRRRVPPQRRSRAFWGAAALAVAVATFGGWWAWARLTGHGRGSLAALGRVRADPRRVAVLYFESEADGRRLSLIAGGLTEDLIDQLGQVDGLQVISANGVRPYRERPVRLDSLVTALSVGTVVAGTVGGSPDRPWLAVRLIDPVTGQQLDSKRLEPASGNVLALRGELIQEVSRFLRERLGKEIRQKELRAGTTNPDAWILMRRADDLSQDAGTLYAAGDSAGSRRLLDAADSLLRVVEHMDPGAADPIVLRGWVAAQRITLAVGTTGVAVRQWAPQGIAHAERALARRPTYPPALELRGFLREVAWRYAGRSDPDSLAAAERDLRGAAVPENPTQARAWSALSGVLQAQGSFAEANLAATRAYETDAFLAAAPAVVFRLYLTSMTLRRWKEAADWCALGYSRFPTDWLFSFCRLTLLFMPSGQRPDAATAWLLVKELERVTSPTERAVLAPRWQMIVAGVLARAGQQDSARHTLGAARAAAAEDREIGYYEAGVHVLLGEHDRALDLLEHFVAHSPQRRRMIEGDPAFEALHRYARFRALVTEPRAAGR